MNLLLSGGKLGYIHHLRVLEKPNTTYIAIGIHMQSSFERKLISELFSPIPSNLSFSKYHNKRLVNSDEVHDRSFKVSIEGPLVIPDNYIH